MTDEVRTEVEQIKQQEEVKQALKQTGAKEEFTPVAETKDKLWLGTHLLFVVWARRPLLLAWLQESLTLQRESCGYCRS